MKTLFLSLFAGLTVGSAIAYYYPVEGGQSWEQNLLDAFDAAATHSLAFNHYNIHKCIKGHIKQDCFAAIDDVQKTKQILKNEKNISKHDKDLTVFQFYLLQQIGIAGIKEDELRFWITQLDKNFIEDFKKYVIKKRD